MLYAIASTTADVLGHVLVNATPGVTETEIGRRLSRIATLDGGATVVDAGFSDADRVIELSWVPPSVEYEDNMLRMMRTYSSLVVSAPSGVFTAAPELYKPGSDRSTLRLLITARLSS